ncbi:Pro-Pol polyprotein [Halotydeus destructor]|nr:Pro-Pol polyprotein [Halotydeus destructor]
MQHADALSRSPLPIDTFSDRSAGDDAINFIAQSFLGQAEPFSSNELIEAQRAEAIKSDIIRDGVACTSKRGLIRQIVPDRLRSSLIRFYHESHGHVGVNKTLRLLQTRFWWLQMSRDVKSVIGSCEPCQMVKPHGQRTIGLLTPLEALSEPNQRWGMDTIVMGSVASSSKAKYVQVVIDHATRYLWTFPTPKNTTATVINCLTSLFKSGLKPALLLTDRGTNFTSSQFRHFLESRSVKHLKTSPYHPQTNGMCEKVNDNVIKRMKMKTFEKPKLKWSSHLNDLTSEYNETIHDVTRFTPFFLMYGRHPAGTAPIDNLPCTVEDARSQALVNTRAFMERLKAKTDPKRQLSTFKEGDLVTMVVADNHPSRNKLSPNNEGPYKVLKITSPNTVQLDRSSHSQVTSIINVSQLKLFKPP